MQKISDRSISICIYPENLVTSEECWTFGHPKRPFWTTTVPKRDMMWYEILRLSFFLGHCASFISRWSLLRGRGVCISVVRKQPNLKQDGRQHVETQIFPLFASFLWIIVYHIRFVNAWNFQNLINPWLTSNLCEKI